MRSAFGAIKRAVEEDLDGDKRPISESAQCVKMLGEALCCARDMLRFVCVGDMDTVVAATDSLVAALRYSSRRALDLDGSDPSNAASAALAHLCQPLHGDAQHILRVVLQALLPTVLAPAQTNIVSFVKYASKHYHSRSLTLRNRKIIAQNADVMCEPLVAFIQHMCVRVTDRAENRQHTADAICELVAACTQDVLTRVVKFLETLSRSTKAAHRLFAVEVGINALQREDLDRLFSLSPDESFDPQLVLLSVIVSRCMDKVCCFPLHPSAVC